MATPAPMPTTPAIQGEDIDLNALIAEAKKNAPATGGKFTWTPPKSTQGLDPGTTGIGRRLMSGGLLSAGERFPAAQPVAETVDALTFGQRVTKMDRSEIEQLQHQLYDAGAYSDAYYGKNPKKIPWGEKDPETMSLLQNMATLAATFTGSLDSLMGAKADLGSIGATKRAPLVIELPSQDDMTAVLKDSAMELLGRDPTPDELARYSASFTERVKAYQTQQYAAGEAGGTVTQAPNAANAAEAMLQQSSPVEAGAQRIEKGLSALRQLFTGGSQ
jgi:hypothetical protein